MTTSGDERHYHKNSLSGAMANSSQRLAVNANKNKNWRANYLRALNIFTPDLATSTRTRHASNGERRHHDRRRTQDQATTTRRRAQDQVPSRPVTREPSSVSTNTSARQSSSRSGSSTKSQKDEKPSTYVFGMRQHLFRARRQTPHSDVVTVDHVSAPIEIPTGTSVTSPTKIPSRADKLSERRDSSSRRRRGSSNDFQGSTDQQPMMQLLSWEEPSVMLGNGNWPLESEKRRGGNHGSGVSMTIPTSRNRKSSRPYVVIAEEYEDTEDDEPTTTENDDDDDIFKMEFDGEGGDSNAKKNVFRSSERRRPELQRYQDFDELNDGEDNNVVQPLSASFVPPHQMVERGCFSLGLRDELKRKPGLHI